MNYKNNLVTIKKNNKFFVNYFIRNRKTKFLLKIWFNSKNKNVSINLNFLKFKFFLKNKINLNFSKRLGILFDIKSFKI